MCPHPCNGVQGRPRPSNRVFWFRSSLRVYISKPEVTFGGVILPSKTCYIHDSTELFERVRILETKAGVPRSKGLSKQDSSRTREETVLRNMKCGDPPLSAFFAGEESFRPPNSACVFHGGLEYAHCLSPGITRSATLLLSKTEKGKHTRLCLCWRCRRGNRGNRGCWLIVPSVAHQNRWAGNRHSDEHQRQRKIEEARRKAVMLSLHVNVRTEDGLPDFNFRFIWQKNIASRVSKYPV